jgi:hypothetical protein
MKRRNRAVAKLDPVRPPGERPGPEKVAVSGARTGQLETLTCRSCGSTFDRPVTRGRKPSLCEGCRASTS